MFEEGVVTPLTHTPPRTKCSLNLPHTYFPTITSSSSVDLGLNLYQISRTNIELAAFKIEVNELIMTASIVASINPRNPKCQRDET